MIGGIISGICHQFHEVVDGGRFTRRAGVEDSVPSSKTIQSLDKRRSCVKVIRKQMCWGICYKFELVK